MQQAKTRDSPGTPVFGRGFFKGGIKCCITSAGAFYLRLVGKPLEVYQYLEPLYNDYRRVRLRTEEGHFTLTHVDELVDEMLRNEYLFDIALPRVPNRYH